MGKRRPFGEGEPAQDLLLGSATPTEPIDANTLAIVGIRVELEAMRRQIATMNDQVIILKRATGVR